MVLLRRNRGGGGELLTLPLLPSELHQLTPSSGGPDDTDGGIHKHRVEPIHQDQRRLTGERVGAAEAISQDVRAAEIKQCHLRHVQQSDLAFGCGAGGQHLDAVDPVGAAFVLQRRGATATGDLLLQQVGEVRGVEDEAQAAQLSVGIQHRVNHVGQLGMRWQCSSERLRGNPRRDVDAQRLVAVAQATEELLLDLDTDGPGQLGQE